MKSGQESSRSDGGVRAGVTVKSGQESHRSQGRSHAESRRSHGGVTVAVGGAPGGVWFS